MFDDFSLTVKTTGTSDGIEAVQAEAKLPVKVADGRLYVGGAKGERISVINAAGQTLATAYASDNTTTIDNLPQGQTLIVKAGKKVAKVIL